MWRLIIIIIIIITSTTSIHLFFNSFSLQLLQPNPHKTNTLESKLPSFDPAHCTPQTQQTRLKKKNPRAQYKTHIVRP
ncbi:predicted protein [Plenodomus lingam JN3]|uniref:Predicted protein n=1 Tax=Leptosphaeria maculans (strain JN3 / isolate v23.1.3 / race Av1-4-5-6-7-8) TaxID=985895 RepID=E5A1W6_LEPMJ|nr:predicted protein [Plenodomus lingam JN3]CBX97683.1 predicted protein [Plenodomus lingam JN3]